jgi:hypothetical protein
MNSTPRLFGFHSSVSFLVAAAVVLQAPLASVAMAQTQGETFQLRKEDPQVRQGSVYYTYSKKNEVLFKANIWGSVQYPGVHYLPLGTRFLDGLSIAGGPTEAADTDDIVLSTKAADGKPGSMRIISVKQALTNQDLNPVLQPDDVVFIKENRTMIKTTFYLSIGAFLLSAATFAVLVSRSH